MTLVGTASNCRYPLQRLAAMKSVLAFFALVAAAGLVSAADAPDGFVNNGTIGTYPCAVGTSSGDKSNSQTSFVSGQTLGGCPEALQPVYPFNKINIRAPDDSVRASFMPYGSRMVEFWTRDRDGAWQDVLLGLDNTTNYRELAKTVHPFFGPQVGRYANRIKNGTFEIDGKIFHTPLNENNISTLHGGNIGYDQRHYAIETWNASHVSFVLHDADGTQGFPGSVVARASYSLLDMGELHIRMDANVTTSNNKTPIMLSHHGYWALHGYKDANNTILNHTLHMPKANKYIKTDGINIPTGAISKVAGTPLDFRKARKFSERFNETHNLCGTGCQGWDNCWVMSDGHARNEDILTLSSPETGIRLRIKTDQDAIQVYTCDGISGAKGSLPRKYAHGGDGTLDKIYENHSCLVLEMEGEQCRGNGERAVPSSLDVKVNH